MKIVMLGMVEGDRPHGRPARRWSDDITDWCRCSLPEVVQLERSHSPQQPTWGMSSEEEEDSGNLMHQYTALFSTLISNLAYFY